MSSPLTPKQYIRKQLRGAGIPDAAYDNERKAWVGTVQGQFHRVKGNDMLDAAKNFVAEFGLVVDLSAVRWTMREGFHVREGRYFA